jgi:hypothetical protein
LDIPVEYVEGEYAEPITGLVDVIPETEFVYAGNPPEDPVIEYGIPAAAAILAAAMPLNPGMVPKTDILFGVI